MRKVIFVLMATAVPALAQQDFSKVEIKVTKVAGTVYMLQGAGGNIGVSVGDDGIVIVDDRSPLWHRRSELRWRRSPISRSNSFSTRITTAITPAAISNFPRTVRSSLTKMFGSGYRQEQHCSAAWYRRRQEKRCR